MGLYVINNNNNNNDTTRKHVHVHNLFILCNYILLGAASSCIFLTLSLRLFPSLCGGFLILLHVFTILGAVSGCAAVSNGTNRWYSAHMVLNVLTAIFQGSVSVLIFTNTSIFLSKLDSYVREEDGGVILKLGGGVGGVIFFLEWVVLTLAFFLKYYDIVEGNNNNNNNGNGKVQQDGDFKDWSLAFKV